MWWARLAVNNYDYVLNSNCECVCFNCDST